MTQAPSFDRAALRAIIERFNGRRIAVLGDVMLDRYLWGRVERISPEAPVPVVEVERESCSLGGAGNVAANAVDDRAGYTTMLGHQRQDVAPNGAV